MPSKWLSIRELLSGIIEPLPKEMESFIVCEICGEDRKIKYAAELSWSAGYGSYGMSFDLYCGCEDEERIKFLQGFDEGWLKICFTSDEVYISEIQMSFADDLTRERRLQTIEHFSWSAVERKLANFLQLPFGFEDKQAHDLMET